jgi:PPIC-type PPIASE domain
MRRLAAIALLAGALVACRDSAARPAAEPVDVVARFGDEVVTARELDAWIVALPPAERPKPGADLEAWYEGQIRELLVARRLRSEAEAGDLKANESFVTARREAEKRLAVSLCVAALLPADEGVAAAELRAAYDSRKESFALPERRAVYNLFLRRLPRSPPDARRREIEALRDRVLAGESFTRLAAAHSDSESRHREGSIGWVKRGELPAGFEKVIFSLDEGVPSEPVVTRDGLHLFYVDQILPARQLTFAEVRKPLRAHLVAERREAALDKLEAGITPPPGTVVVDRKELAAIAEAGDPDAVVLHMGDSELTLADLRRHLRRTLAQLAKRPESSPPPATVDLAYRQLQELRRRELLYEHCKTTGAVPAAALAARLTDWEGKALLSMQRQRRLLALAKRDDARLRTFYESNVGRFSKPPKWHLRRLRIPLDGKARAHMARLEKAAVTPGTTLAALRGELGGEIDDLGLVSLADLRRIEPKLPPLVAGLPAGSLSAPYHTASTLEIAESVARKESEPLPYAEVRDRVADAYVQQYTREVYEELEDDVLQSAKLDFVPAGLAALRSTAGVPPPDVSVEQLDELFAEVRGESAPR